MNTKANVGERPGKRKFLGDLTQDQIQPNNHMDEDVLKDMSFKVKPDFHAKFKVTAASSGLSMKELLEQSFQAWIEKMR